MALMVHDYAIITPDFAVLISFVTGCTILVLGILNLGVLVRFISMPVIMGFTMAAACTIGSAQINNLFGIKSKKFLITKNAYISLTITVTYQNSKCICINGSIVYVIIG